MGIEIILGPLVIILLAYVVVASMPPGWPAVGAIALVVVILAVFWLTTISSPPPRSGPLDLRATINSAAFNGSIAALVIGGLVQALAYGQRDNPNYSRRAVWVCGLIATAIAAFIAID